MNKIGIDMTHYGKMGGYGVVATNIINRLLTSNEYEFYLLSTEKKELPNNLRNKKNIHWVISDVKFYFLYRLWTQASLLKKYKIDIFYTPDQIVPLRKVCKYISTIHDLYDYKNFSGLKAFKLKNNREKLYHFLHFDKIFSKKSDFIITPSIASKIDILEQLNLKEEKIILCHWGMDHIKSDKHISINKKNYILFPLCEDFDNHFIFRLGEEILRNNYTDSIIYWRPHSRTGQVLSSVDKRIRIINKKITEQEKSDLISGAFLSIYVSIMEGFGFPPLECQILGCPVVYHKIGSLGEIVGDSGIGINGLNISDYLEQVGKIVNDDEMYDKVRDLGYKNAKSYSWDGTVTIIEGLFEKNLGNLK